MTKSTIHPAVEALSQTELTEILLGLHARMDSLGERAALLIRSGADLRSVGDDMFRCLNTILALYGADAADSACSRFQSARARAFEAAQ